MVPARRTRISASLFAVSIVALGCGIPDFGYETGSGGATSTTTSSGGAGGAASSSSSTSGGGASSTSSASSSASSASSTSSSSSSSSSTGGPACPIDHLLISEVRTRGPGGASDDFVELYNPTSEPIQLDSSYSLYSVSVGNLSYTKRWVGGFATIPPRGHYLIAGAGYAGPPVADSALNPSITDAASLLLDHAGVTVDALCYFKDTITLIGLVGYECEGGAVLNPHDDSDSTNTAQSLERRPGGNFGHCVDSGDNASDFAVIASKPQSSQSPPTP